MNCKHWHKYTFSVRSDIISEDYKCEKLNIYSEKDDCQKSEDCPYYEVKNEKEIEILKEGFEMILLYINDLERWIKPIKAQFNIYEDKLKKIEGSKNG